MRSVLWRRMGAGGVSILIALLCYACRGKPAVRPQDIPTLPGGPSYGELHTHVPALYRQARQLAGQRHFDKAEAVYRQAIAAEPDNAQAYIGVGSCRYAQDDKKGAEENYRKALQLDPHSVRALVCLGTMAGRKQNYRDAETYYRRAVALAPSLADAHEGLGMSYDYEGRTADAIKEYREAVRLAPRSVRVRNIRNRLDYLTAPRKANPLASWPLPEPFKVTAKDLDFGEQQVERMVHDRPEMARYVSRQSPIWQWCVRQFAGVALGQRLYWNNGEPVAKAYMADHHIADEKEPGYIQIRKSRRRMNGIIHVASCSELWANAVFELNNMSNDPQFKQVYHNAFVGKLTKDAWIEQITHIEYMSSIKTAQVYEHLWKDTSAAQDPSATYWKADTPNTYEWWIAGYADHSGYPWDYYGKYYDDGIEPYLKSIGKWPPSR